MLLFYAGWIGNDKHRCLGTSKRASRQLGLNCEPIARPRQVSRPATLAVGWATQKAHVDTNTFLMYPDRIMRRLQIC